MTQKHKNIRIAGAVVFGVLIVWGITALARKKEPGVLPEVPEITFVETSPVVTAPKTLPRTTASTDVVVAPVLTYDEALAQYADKRIQFDRVCQATPNVSTYKTATRIMLDNRAPESRTISIGTLRAVTIPAWGFTTLELTAKKLPETLDVDCNESENVATIIVQQ
jgi:hypothetical protein